MARSSIDPQSQVPIFQQIVNELERNILTGELKPGDFLTSVREFALKNEVNPNTVAKAYQQLQSLGLAETVRGTGLRVLPMDPVKGLKRRNEILQEKVDECLHLAKLLSVPIAQLMDLIRERSRK